MYEIQTAELSLYESFEFEKMRAIVNLFFIVKRRRSYRYTTGRSKILDEQIAF